MIFVINIPINGNVIIIIKRFLIFKIIGLLTVCVIYGKIEKEMY